MKIVCIGSGNVATHMAQAFKASGATVLQVWSKNQEHALALASKIEASAISDLTQIDASADLYLIVVKDDAIPEIAASLKSVRGLVLHTSGATDILALASIQNHGVLYPLQTFSKARPIDFAEVPLFLEANSESSMDLLRSVAAGISARIYEVDSEKRRILHLSAVFACNFVNQLYALSQDLLVHHGLEFGMLKPLIMETALKVQSAIPREVQTGPAVRGDEQTMNHHLALLGDMPELAEIYRTLSNSIKKTHS